MCRVSVLPSPFPYSIALSPPSPTFCSSRSAGAEQAAAELAAWRRLLVLSVSLTLPVFLIAVVLPRVPLARRALDSLVLGFPLGQLMKWALTTPIQVGHTVTGGAHPYR